MVSFKDSWSSSRRRGDKQRMTRKVCAKMMLLVMIGRWSVRRVTERSNEKIMKRNRPAKISGRWKDIQSVLIVEY
jgi:hypothetical protein